MRNRNPVFYCLLSCYLGWLFIGCSSSDPEPTPTPTPTNAPDCIMDDSQRGKTETTWMLTPEEETELQYVCPKGDIDHFWFQLDDPRSIVTIDLKNNVNMTEVDYCLDLFFQSQQPPIGSACDFDGSDGVTQIEASFYLESEGTYFLEVRDASLDDFDSLHPYLLKMATQPDPDSNEPNNSADQATPLLSAQPISGYISYQEDPDWFAISGVSAGQVMEIELSTTEGSPVDLHYTLFSADGQTVVNEGEDNNGLDQATYLQDALPLKYDGTYYLRITDVQGNDSDISIGYTLQVNIYSDPDSMDQTAPYNNSWENAEPLATGVAVTGRAISYRGDEDWYVIDSSVGYPALLEIDLNVGGSHLSPQVDLYYADPDHICAASDACDLLAIERTCTGDLEDSVELCNARCPSHECFIQGNQCRGAGMCVPKDSSQGVFGCGIGMLIMHGVEWSEDGNPRHLHTVAPMKGLRYYIKVSNFQSASYDLQATYSLTVSVLDEPDSNEPNGLYIPYLTDDQEDDTRNWNRTMATQVTCTTTPAQFTPLNDITAISCTVTGYLSFRGDQDWFKLSVPYDDPNTLDVDEEDFFIPMLDEATPEGESLYVDWNIEFDWNYAGRDPIEAGIVLYRDWSAMGFTAEVGDPGGLWGNGDGQCSYFCGEYHTPREAGYLWVFTPDFKGYDYDTPYTITINATRGCPANCGYCAADCTAWCCPNPNNPSP